VADSIPEMEYEETLTKAQGFEQALKLTQRISDTPATSGLHIRTS